VQEEKMGTALSSSMTWASVCFVRAMFAPIPPGRIKTRLISARDRLTQKPRPLL
jgi:hypothetical protein